MNKLLYLAIGILLVGVICPLPVSADDVPNEQTTGLFIATHTITITTTKSGLSVSESLHVAEGITNETYKTMAFWLPTSAEDVSIAINSNAVTSAVSGNEYLCNLSSLSIPMNTSVQVAISYALSSDNEEFQRTLLHDTASLTIAFNNQELYSAQQLIASTSVTLRLYKPTEAPLSWYIIAFIFLLVILLAVSMFYSFRKQRSSTIKKVGGDSQEVLQTRKKLLMSLLKEIEKQHRAQQISDDAYHKLKEQYKQQAVETMKALEENK
ncbi:MAG: hypothetical protein JW771_05445 [Candidatus Thermoplasmatota archaeon]|nr:hypothetical protein [Candidatus Thermoplasmatota archaeon]